MQNAKYISNFLKQVAISFERGDIDVRTSHAKSQRVFALFRMYNVLDTLMFTKNHEKSAEPDFGPRLRSLTNV